MASDRTWADNTDAINGFGGTITTLDRLFIGVGGGKPTTNLDFYQAGTYDMATVHYGENAAVRMGNETNGPWIFSCDNTNAGRVFFFGQSDWYVACGGAAIEQYRTTISSPKGATLYHGEGTYPIVELFAGGYRAAATAIITTYYQGGGNAYITYSATAITAGSINGGVCQSHRTFTTLNVRGGTFIQGEKNQTIGTLNVDGGRVVIKGGTITTLNLRGGILDCSKLEAPLTITNTSSEYWEGAEIINPPGQGNGVGIFITYTNAPTIRGRHVKGYMKTN